jgi:beta-xylosidase
LARKFQDAQKKTRRASPEDIHRYTVLTESPDDLVNAAEYTVERLRRPNWQVTYAVHSYTEGSRYKGIHAYLRTPGGQRVEVQFHSAEAARVKQLTTPWYEIERNPKATPRERTAARARCTELSDTLKVPRGLHDLSYLGGVRIAVRNYSDSRTTGQPTAPKTSAQGPMGPGAQQGPSATMNKGITR